jgi:hypothetical protein
VIPPRERSTGGYADQVGAHPTPWEGPIPALDLFLHDLGLGIFLVATLGAMAAPRALVPLLALGWPLSFAIVGVDMLLLLVDLGDWTRFFHMFRVWKPGTPMSLGVWSLSGFMGAATVPAAWGALYATGFVQEGPGWPVQVLALVALLFALPASIYKGAIFSVTSQPGWMHARWTAGYFSASSVLLGGAALGPFASAWGMEGSPLLWRAALALSVVEGALLVAWARGVRSELALRAGRSRAAAFWMLQAGARVATVLVLLVPPATGGWVLVASLVLLPGYLMRATFVGIPHMGRRAAAG